MKRVFSSLCLIISLPILFAGPAKLGGRHGWNQGYGVAIACGEMSSSGNCAEFEHKAPAEPTSESKGTDRSPTTLVGLELAALTDVLLIWMLRL
jgi:hypothetical protein